MQVILTRIAFCAICLALGFSWHISLAIALVLNLLQERKLLNNPVGAASFLILLFQDIAVIPILIVMPLLSKITPQKNPDSVNLIANFSSLYQTLIIAGVILLVVVRGVIFCVIYFA